MWPRRAWLSVPSVAVAEPVGKLLFVAGDLGIGWLLYAILTRFRRASNVQATKLCAVFLLNPFTIGISTRGSHDSLTSVLVLAALYLLLLHSVVSSGIV